MNGRRHESVSKGMHGQQRRHLNGIPEIIGERSLCHRRAGRGLDSNYMNLLSCNLVSNEWKCAAREIASAPSATYYDIGIIPDFGELFFCFQADNRLMK